MKRKPYRRGRKYSRGSALLTVTIVLFVLGTICASMLVNVTFEKRMVRRTIAVSQCKLNTDILLNYAASQVTNNATLAYSSPPGLVAVPSSLFPVDSVSGSSSDTLALAVPTQQEIIACPMTALVNTASDGPKYYIDAKAPINRNDKFVGQYVFREICLIAAKAAVANPQSATAAPLNNYGLLVLERRKISLFNYLAFFDVARFRITNPGSNIVLNGPIQANQGLYFEAGGQTSTVYMDSSVHTPLDMVFSGSTSAGKFTVTDGTFKSDGVTPNRIDLLKPGTSVLRSTADDINYGADKLFGTSDDTSIGSSFYNFMNNSTKNFLRTGESGETKVILDGLNYVDDSSSTVSDTYKVSTNRRIDPTNPTLRNSTDPAYSDARTAEAAKTAYQASLYVYVEQNGTATVFVNQNSDSYSNQTSQAASDAWKSVESYKAAADKAAWKAANPGAILSAAETASFITLPSTQRYYDGYTSLSVGKLSVTAPTSTTKYQDISRGAIYDSQQRATVSMVDINMGALNTKIAGAKSLAKANGAAWSTSATTGWNGVMYVDVQSPGSRMKAPVVDAKTGNYVDATTGSFVNTTTGLTTGTTQLTSSLVATQPTLNVTGQAKDFDTGALVSDTTGLTAVRIKNANTIPGSQVGDPGFTFATNTATYTVGSFNADGNASTGTTSLQDDQTKASDATSKIPAAIFSDKNIVLSGDFANSAYDLDLYVPKPSSKPSSMPQYMYDNWPFTGPASSSSTYTLAGSGNGYYQYQRDPGTRGKSGDPGLGAGSRVMELSTAFVVGDDESTNKGMHTILSFLQPFNTSSDSLIMRGSMIGIYKARYFNKAAGSFNDYYVAPSRNYGFSSLFQSGKMPPAAPTISNYRRMRQIALTPSDYATLKSSSATLDNWLKVVNKY